MTDEGGAVRVVGSERPPSSSRGTAAAADAPGLLRDGALGSAWPGTAVRWARGPRPRHVLLCGRRLP